ncbi:MAG: S-methyl-5-thioribose-1-phosphate isomerase [Deltaproteobacteria bacterium]|nr:S-methyl-5-thioribose-1-phosphate isomerase [Deltaproteobacteria bacterium]
MTQLIAGVQYPHQPPYLVASYQAGRLTVLDQTSLPLEERNLVLEDLESVEHAIRTLTVRGAPLIGVSAAYGFCVAMQASAERPKSEADPRARDALTRLRATRPTAVNLFWAMDRMESVWNKAPETGWFTVLEQEALAIHQDGVTQDQKMADYAASLLVPEARLITHCNTGPLATGALGTALGALIHGHNKLGGFHVYADETRPRLQGGRLTIWELARHKVPHTLICDNMAASLMSRGNIHSVWVGADRIAANGDTANKIGTFPLAISAARHKVPFYVVAPTSTVDPTTTSGKSIPIEERSPEEITQGMGVGNPPVWNPAFDVTPAELISAIITEQGVHRGPRYNFSGMKHVRPT